MDNDMREAFQNAYLELGSLGERVLGEERCGQGAWGECDPGWWGDKSRALKRTDQTHSCMTAGPLSRQGSAS